MSGLRRGFTLPEMLVSLGVTAMLFAMAVQLSTGQLRFFRGVGEIAAVRSQLGHVTGILASVFWGVAPGAGDIVVAQDSAIELRATTGSAIVCESMPGRMTIPASSAATGNTLGGYLEAPAPGDDVAAFFEDSSGGTWLTLHVASAPASGGSCTIFPFVTNAWTVALREPLVVPIGTVLRFTQPLRFSLYRASDTRWYLGARDWNAGAQRFNTIQPVAGPLEPFSGDASATGLRFSYRDALGTPFPNPTETGRIASIRIDARGSSRRPVRLPALRQPDAAYLDSTGVLISLRNSR